MYPGLAAGTISIGIVALLALCMSMVMVVGVTIAVAIDPIANVGIEGLGQTRLIQITNEAAGFVILNLSGSSNV